MSFLAKARRLESKLARTFDRAAEQWTKSGPRAPLELLHAIVDSVEEGLEPAGRGRHLFAFNKITVSIVARSRDAQTRLAALFDAEPSLRERVIARLADAGCQVPDLQIDVVFVDHPAPDWIAPDLHVAFDRLPPPAMPPQSSPATDTVVLTIVHGSAEKRVYEFSHGTVNLGRCSEVRDSRNRLIRTNQVVFSDVTGDANSTVSRQHAHIEYARDSRQYRICDDGSVHGTGIVRNGRTISVPCGPRGIGLRSGDELLLGEARLRVTIENC